LTAKPIEIFTDKETVKSLSVELMYECSLLTGSRIAEHGKSSNLLGAAGLDMAPSGFPST
jgi:hypothetical protein